MLCLALIALAFGLPLLCAKPVQLDETPALDGLVSLTAPDTSLSSMDTSVFTAEISTTDLVLDSSEISTVMIDETSTIIPSETYDEKELGMATESSKTSEFQVTVYENITKSENSTPTSFSLKTTQHFAPWLELLIYFFVTIAGVAALVRVVKYLTRHLQVVELEHDLHIPLGAIPFRGRIISGFGMPVLV